MVDKEQFVQDVLTKKGTLIEFFQKNTFVKSMLDQNIEEICKSEEKWTDNLFPPEDSSLYSGKTEFGKDYIKEVPKFLQVK